MNIVGKNIRTLRQRQGWSQTQVANRINISVPALSKIETGITDINISRLNQIAALFQVSVFEIIAADSVSAKYVFKAELEECNTQLTQARREVINLQVKLIKVFEENRELVAKWGTRSFDIPVDA